MKYRKKPVIIEAFQMTESRRQDNSEWPAWLNEAWNRHYTEEGAVFPKDYLFSNGNDPLCINTMEGVLNVLFGDYIIKGVMDEIYPCRPDIFEATYEEVIDA